MKNWKEIEQKMQTLDALQHAMNKILYDMETIAPSGAIPKIGKTLETLSGIYYYELVDNGLLALIEAEKEADYLEAISIDAIELDDLSREEKAAGTFFGTTIEWDMMKELKREIQKISKIPADSYRAFQELSIIGHAKWLEAKAANDFAIFAPTLKKIIAYKKQYIEYQGYDQHPYDALLDDYEPGLTVTELDIFFSGLREKIIPFLKKINASEKMQAITDKKIGEGFFLQAKQEEFMVFLAKYIGYDFNRGQLGISAHPFSQSFSNDDARITTRYVEHDIYSSIFSILHEFGHAIYEQNIAEKLTMTPLGSGISMGIHESQSRFYENMIGRSESFWNPIYPAIQAFFPDSFADVCLADFIASINLVEQSFIRVEADELTYPLHIMVRYEIEKKLFSDTLTVEQLPEAWNTLMMEYLGITPANVNEGILQDIHWSQGYFGYFPTYALGSAYSAQFFEAMKREVDVEKDARDGDFTAITSFLARNIHQFGKLKTPKELMIDTTGEAFNPDYYIDYLIEKYSTLFLNK
ncbi:carboxypeptidase M32 [Erysipelotrichaceae bacterium]|nr:carboxypeptidase M32 [Erysipelotrichaceae bacterium]